MYENYHSKYIVYPVLQEHKIIQYLKDHKLKNTLQEIITIIKPFEDILIKPRLIKENLTITILFSTTITGHLKEHITKQIENITQNNKKITLRYMGYNEYTFNTLRGFN